MRWISTRINRTGAALTAAALAAVVAGPAVAAAVPGIKLQNAPSAAAACPAKSLPGTRSGPRAGVAKTTCAKDGPHDGQHDGIWKPADIYLHHPRGSNNRLSGDSAARTTP